MVIFPNLCSLDNSPKMGKKLPDANHCLVNTQSILCRTKVVMSALSKVKVSSFAGVDLGVNGHLN